MKYIPDPTEILQSNVERLEEKQLSVDGKTFKCWGCDKLFSIDEAVSANERPDSPIVCFDCFDNILNQLKEYKKSYSAELIEIHTIDSDVITCTLK